MVYHASHGERNQQEDCEKVTSASSTTKTLSVNAIIATETIVAQATPSGRGGVAIVRLSGHKIKTIMLEMLHCELTPRVASYLPFYDQDDQIIDIGITIFFPAPHSFTGEDILELHCHGGPILIDLLIQRILTLGARLARPGEFSERAFLNGKLDLTQAEAIADLIDASSVQAARLAMRSLRGDFAHDIQLIVEKIIKLRMYVEAAIDFSDEEIDFLQTRTIIQQLDIILKEITNIQAKAKEGAALREGLTVVIAGEPNVGKSSLLNALSNNEIAIVTDIPGTTRDILRERIIVDGMPIHIIDTAGLRNSKDIVEQEGIKRAYDEIKRADLVLYVVDTEKYQNITEVTLPAEIQSLPVIFIFNKIDLVNLTPMVTMIEKQTIIMLSVKLNLGINLLKDQLKQFAGLQSTTEGLYLARRRHLDALSRTHEHLKNAYYQLSQAHASELAAEDLRLAQLALNEITGEFTADDLLGKIFSSFCIGK